MGRALPRSPKMPAEHLQEVLKCLGLMTVKENTENPAELLPIYVGDLTEAEVQGGIKCMKNHKAPGTENITAKMVKAGSKYIVSWMTRI